MKFPKTLIALTLPYFLFSTTALADTSVGAYVNYDGASLTTIDQFNADTVRPAATINIFSTFSIGWHLLTQQSSNVVSRGAIPMITWMPYNSADPDSNVLQEITNGQWDSYIDNWIEGLISWRNSYPESERPKVFLRFAHEFNGTWYPWGNKPEDLKAAWRYLHEKFVAAGVNEAVGWVWCANNVDVDDYNDVTAYYPGDDVVDWLSIDGYNWGSNYSFTRWKSFDETFSHSYVNLVSQFPDKPVMLAEVGSAEPHDMPDPNWGQNGDDSDALESKEAWIADMMQRIQESYPAIKSIVWFNTNKELSWALNDDVNTGLNAYNAAVVSDYFGGVLSVKSGADSTSDRIPKGKANNQRDSYSTKSKTQGDNERGLVHAGSVSRMPDIVGAKLLAKEAEGLRGLSKEQLEKIRGSRLLEMSSE